MLHTYYKVSIIMNTYNHEPYVKQALEGIISQKTSFPFNLVIFDDASTDETPLILRHYEMRYPDLIHCYISETNTWGKPQYHTLLYGLTSTYCTGEYLCICEGDDAWTDSGKLQLQADYLDANAACSLVCHDYEIENHSTGLTHFWSYYPEDCVIPPEDLILQPYGNLATASMMMRRNVFFPEKGFPMQAGEFYDYHYHLHALLKGYVWYFNKSMSLYRYLHSGSWSEQHKAEEARNRFLKSRIDFLKEYDDYTAHRFQETIEKKIQDLQAGKLLPNF